MATENSYKYTIGLCPNEVEDNSIEYETPKTSLSSSGSDSTSVTTVYLLQIGSTAKDEGVLIDVKLCPEGETCGCEYSTNISWTAYADKAGNLKRVLVRWKNPDKCTLDKIRLTAKSVWQAGWDDLEKYIHYKSGDPGTLIYPDGDERNEGICFGCGIGGESDHPAGQEYFWDLPPNYIIPGMIYRVVGYFRDKLCGGVETPVSLGYSLFHTPGLTSGVITEKLTENPPLFLVEVNEVEGNAVASHYVQCYSSDYYNFMVGENVMLVKINAQYPTPIPSADIEEAIERHTDGDTPFISDMVIVPYNEVT